MAAPFSSPTAQAAALPGESRDTVFRALLEAAPDAMIIVDPAGVIVLVNQQVETVFGYGREELLGQTVELLVPESLRAAHPAHRHGYFADPRPRPMGAGIQLSARRKDGTEFPADISLAPLRTADGVMVIAAVRDVTERRRLEEAEQRRKNQELEEQNRRMQEANRLKSEFLANMSHELRTPLNAIIGFAELMARGKVGPVSDEHKEYLGDILTSSRHLLQIINDVLDIAKVESGRMELRPEAVDVAQLVNEVRDILRGIAADKRIRVEVYVDPRLTGVETDPGRFKQVLYNYLSNAVKFTPEEGRVQLRVKRTEDDMFRLEVEDNGIGIRAEDMQRLFIEFQQLDAGTNKMHPGTGLGLALTRRIVEACGGQVGVRSEPGKGSTFFALLPRVSKQPEAMMPVMPRAALPGAPAILVIEDTRRERDWIRRALERVGYAVDLAATGAEALALAMARPYDAITLDLVLPDASGWQVLEAIRNGGPNAATPVVVLSVVEDVSPAARANPAVKACLVKPVSENTLVRALQDAGVRAASAPGGPGHG